MVSVVVPAYNVEKCIIRTLESIIVQTYKELEIIVVDDGSSDKTGSVLDEYAALHSEKVRVIHKENEGVTLARLKGVEEAKGDWIGFVDGDDEIESDMYELLVKNAVAYNADISHCGYQMVFEDGRVNYFHNTGCLVEQDKITGLKELLDGSRIEPGLCNKLFHKTLFNGLLHNNIMDKSIKINEDLLMNYILFMSAQNSVFVDVCKYHYIVRQGSASRQKLNEHRIYDPIKVKQIIMDISDKELLESAQKAYLSTCINVYNGLVLEKRNKYVSAKQQVRKLIIERKDWIPLLSKKQQLLAKLICNVSIFYPIVYGIYARTLLKNRYS